MTYLNYTSFERIIRNIALSCLISTWGCASSQRDLNYDDHELDRPGSSAWKMENASCKIKGNTANWQAAYCMWMHQSEGFESSPVQECYKMISSRPGIPSTACERNHYFKREICKSLAVDGYFHRSVDQCLASDDAVPLVVKLGLE